MIDNMIVVRDRRQGKRYTCDNLLVDHYLPIIADRGLTFYNVLARLANEKDERAYPSDDLFRRHCGWSRSTVWAYRRLLELCGLVEIIIDNRRANYYLLDIAPLTPDSVQVLRATIVADFRNGFQASVLQRIDAWQPLTFAKPATITIVKAGQLELGLLHGETDARDGEAQVLHGETDARDGEAELLHHEALTTRSTNESTRPKNKTKQQHQQQPSLIYLAADVASALSEAGILESAHQRVAQGWHKATGQALTVDDITAWYEYVETTNASRFDRRTHLRAGFIIDQLRRGNAAPDTHRPKSYQSDDPDDPDDPPIPEIRLPIYTPPDPHPIAGPIWINLLAELQLSVQRSTYDNWLRETQAIAFEDGCFVVAVKNDFAQDWLQQRMKGMITQRLRRLTNSPATVRFVLGQPG